MATVKAISHKDVRGKELFYLDIHEGEHTVLVNVGEGTYKKVKELENVLTLPLDTKQSINQETTDNEQSNMVGEDKKIRRR